jgi:signal recognition particle receptor subunit beta
MDLKILFAGTPGAGKTTAISVLSDLPPMTTEVVNTDASIQKRMTTVGLDYGTVELTEGHRVHLFGAPGQERFDFMWPILARDAMGLVLLIDNSRSDPCADLRLYLKHFGPVLASSSCVVGVGRMETHPSPGLDAFGDVLESHGHAFPVLEVDVRLREDVLNLVEAVIAQAEAQSI